jgi:hypothetical protein
MENHIRVKETSFLQHEPPCFTRTTSINDHPSEVISVQEVNILLQPLRHVFS